MLEVQTVTFNINSLRWRYKQLFSKSNPYAGATNSYIKPPLRCWYIQLSCFLNQPTMLEVQTVAF